jgi:hypothetical protein
MPSFLRNRSHEQGLTPVALGQDRDDIPGIGLPISAVGLKFPAEPSVTACIVTVTQLEVTAASTVVGYSAVLRQAHRLICIDARGPGESDKPHNEASCAVERGVE